MINIVVYGFTSFISQILLIREIIADFGADEIIIAFATGMWIITTSLGVYIQSKILKYNEKIIPFFHSISAFLITAQIIVIRATKKFLSPLGESIDPLTKSAIVLISISIYTIISGVYFSVSAKENEYKKTKTVFVYDSVGFGVGAVLSYLMISHIKLNNIILLVAVINLIVLVKKFPLKYSFYLLSSVLIIIPLNNLKLNTKNRYEIFSTDSHYGRIRVFSNASSNYIYYDSSYIYGPQDRDFVERKVMAGSLFMDDVKTSACLSESLFFCSILSEKSNSDVIYINSDLDFFKIQKRFYAIDTNIKTEFKNPIHFLKKNSSKFSSFIIDKSLPKTLSESIIFSSRFIRMIKESLDKDGRLIIFISYPQSPDRYEKTVVENLYSEIKKNFISSIIYYDDFLMIVASDRKTLKALPKNEYEKFYSEYLKEREKTAKFEPSKKYLSAYLLSILSDISKHMQNLNLSEKNLVLIFYLLLATVIYLLIKTPYNSRVMIISSFISLSCEISAIIFHQIESGYIYRDISLILFSVMIGLSIGTHLKLKQIIALFISALMFASMPFLKNLFLMIPALFISAAMNGSIFAGISEREGVKTYLYDLMGAFLSTVVSVMFFMITTNLTNFLLFAIAVFLILKK